MKKTITISTALLLALSAPAFANGKSAEAQGMAGAIQAAGNGSDPASGIKGGWGNAVGPAKGTNGGKAVDSKPGN